jgi:hypothetical protein
MNLNWIGLIAAIATFMGIWVGHVSVRKIEYHSPTLWVPSIIYLTLGVLLELAAILSKNIHLSVPLGILGITVLWDVLEFWRQHHRVKIGHAPANPSNPRHVHLLQSSKTATTIDWLDRDPMGRPLSPNELQSIRENQK